MKIEKISDSQIRCTLNTSDLHSRSLSLKELAYGSTRARELFHEMIQRAGEEFGFHTEDMPLMVEAIPLSNEGIILNITRLEDPEELDTRFARFAPGIENMDTEENDSRHREVTADLLESLRSLLPEEASENQPAAPKSSKTSGSTETPTGQGRFMGDRYLAAIYRFRSLDPILRAAHVLKDIYRGNNALYKEESEPAFYLALHRGSHSPEEYNKICNILTEYGEKVRSTPATESYYREHLTVLIDCMALQKLAQ